MKVDFKIVKTDIPQISFFSVHMDKDELKVLENFTSHDWTPEKAQEIIDGVENAKTNGVRYEWANEDIHVLAVKEKVFFFDLLAMRAGIGKSEQDLEMSHYDFITFMKDFKKFIEENS